MSMVAKAPAYYHPLNQTVLYTRCNTLGATVSMAGDLVTATRLPVTSTVLEYSS